MLAHVASNQISSESCQQNLKSHAAVRDQGSCHGETDHQVPSSAMRVQINLQVPYHEFKAHFSKQPESTVKGIYDKAVRLRLDPKCMVPAPGCGEGSVMVESNSNNRPHLVLRGKCAGSLKCDKNICLSRVP